MLNIFADALLIATRLGQLPEQPTKRRAPRELAEGEGLHLGTAQRGMGR